MFAKALFFRPNRILSVLYLFNKFKCLTINGNDKDLVSCENLCLKNLYMFHIYLQKLCSNQIRKYVKLVSQFLIYIFTHSFN